MLPKKKNEGSGRGTQKTYTPPWTQTRHGRRMHYINQGRNALGDAFKPVTEKPPTPAMRRRAKAPLPDPDDETNSLYAG